MHYVLIVFIPGPTKKNNVRTKYIFSWSNFYSYFINFYLRYPTIEWGARHPDSFKTSRGQRAKWTDEEISYIGRFARENPTTYNMSARYNHKLFIVFITFNTLNYI